MRILALVKSAEHVCCRYRISAFRPFLEAAGHQLEVRAWPSFWLGRLLLYRRLPHVDAVIVQRRLLRGWQLRLIRQRTRWLIYDFDDAVYLRNSYHPAGHDSPQRTRRFDALVAQADLVVAGTEYLRGQAFPAAAPARVHVVPTCVNVAQYPTASHRADGQAAQLVWVGSNSTIQGLECLAPVLEDLGKKPARLQLKVICNRSLNLHHLPVQFARWSEATEAQELAAADIGISWLPDDPWSRGKCGLKVLQYMAAGLPVVANPVGLQARLVRPGVTGFLADTPTEWRAAIRRLAADAPLRRAMGRAARDWVMQEHDVRVGADRWLTLLDSLPRRVLSRAG